VSDVYIYYFIGPHGPNRKKSLSARPATLEAIKGRGEAVMESQIVVDHTELDGDGFLVAAVRNDASAIDIITAQIESLEARAASRDNEAIDSTDREEKYMLSLESRELRKQARTLKSRRAELVAAEMSDSIDTREFMRFGTRVATE
jgi:hypothetical protein